jgi:DNA-binding phage protein
MHRSNSYNERFSQEIQNPKYARRYIKSMLEEFDLLQVLRMIASKMGTTEFAHFVGERPQNINKFIHGSRSPKRETLDRYLKPFGLETVLQVKEVA